MKTILILDDDVAVRESFTDYFEDNLWEVIQAGSGEEALKILEDTNVDAAIVDVRLSGMDGNEFIRTMCSQRQDVAFVICTGSPEYLVPKDLINETCVASNLMKKPVSDLAELETRVNETIQLINDI